MLQDVLLRARRHGEIRQEAREDRAVDEDRHDRVEGGVLPPAAGALERYPEAGGVVLVTPRLGAGSLGGSGEDGGGGGGGCGAGRGGRGRGRAVRQLAVRRSPL